MIIVADLYKIHHEHVPVNASLLYIISVQYKNEPINFYAEKNHCTYVESFLKKNFLSTPNIIWRPIKPLSNQGEGKRFLIRRIKRELFSLIALTWKLRRQKSKKCFLLYLSPVTSIVYKLFVWRREKSLITLHGDVEFIRLQNTFMRNFLGRCFRLSFQVKRADCKYLALENIIRTNLLDTGFLVPDEVVQITHPYIYRRNTPTSEKYATPLVMGYIGLASVEKNASLFFVLAKIFKDQVRNGNVEFLLVGKNENIPLSEINNLVKGADNEIMLDRDTFDQKLQSIHYAVFFHGNMIYRFTSSGTIYDAFNFEKPIIALKTDLFESFFEKAGKIGFLCNDINEMTTVIESILNGEVSEIHYREMQENMRHFKKHHTLDNIRKALFSQLSCWKAASN